MSLASPKILALGAVLLLSAGIAAYTLGKRHERRLGVAGALAAAAFLEAAFALCLGCIMFRFLMRLGVIPERVCEQCNNLVLQPSTHA